MGQIIRFPDNTIPANWSASSLRQNIEDRGMKLPSGIKKSQLLRIYIDNFDGPDAEKDDHRRSEAMHYVTSSSSRARSPPPPPTTQAPELPRQHSATHSYLLFMSRRMEAIESATGTSPRSTDSTSAFRSQPTATSGILSENPLALETVSLAVRAAIFHGKDTNLAVLLKPHPVSSFCITSGVTM